MSTENQGQPLISKRKEGDATCPSETNTERLSNAAPTSNPSGAAPVVPRPLEQEQWTVLRDCYGSFIHIGDGHKHRLMDEVCDLHNASLRALQEELVAAKQRIKDLEGKEEEGAADRFARRLDNEP